jgi:non-ribosomal peptide synthetase component F
VLASFQVLLMQISGQDDIVVGVDSANRTQMETEPLIGFFINQLALRVKLEGNPTFREVLGRVRAVVLGAYAHQELPFDKLVEVLQPERSPSYTPVFQVKLVFQNVPMPDLRLPEVTLEMLPHEDRAVEFDLILSVAETARGLVATLKYRTDLFTATTITRWLDQWETLLHTVVAQPEVTLDALDEVLRESDQERQRRQIEALDQASGRMFKSIQRRLKI